MTFKAWIFSKVSQWPLPSNRRIFSVTFLAGLLLGGIILEIYVRTTQPHLDLLALTGRIPGLNPMAAWAMTDAYCAYRGKPELHWTSVEKTTNRFGFVSTPELSLRKPPHTVRIVFFGESSTAGTGHDLPDLETWPWKVWMRIRDRVPGRQVEFINAAHGGYTSFESYGIFWSRIRFFSPDLIVVNHGWNEMSYFHKVNDMLSWRTRADGSFNLDLTDTPIMVYQPWAGDRLIWPSQFLTQLRLRFAVPPAAELAPPDVSPALKTAYDPRSLEIFRTHLQLFRETSKLLGVKLLVVKQPTLITPLLAPEHRKRCHCEVHGLDYDAHVEAFRQIYRVIEEEIPPENIIDLTVLSGQPDYFYDHVHPTEIGTSKIADLVADKILLQLNSPAPKYAAKR